MRVQLIKWSGRPVNGTWSAALNASSLGKVVYNVSKVGGRWWLMGGWAAGASQHAAGCCTSGRTPCAPSLLSIHTAALTINAGPSGPSPHWPIG